MSQRRSSRFSRLTPGRLAVVVGVSIAGLVAFAAIRWSVREADRPDVRLTAPATNSAAQSSPSTAAFVEGPLSIRSAGRVAAGDPHQEGWLMEAFSQRAIQQLGKLAECFQRPDVLVLSEGDLLAVDFSCQSLVPDKMPIAYQTDDVSVRRYRDPNAAEQPLHITDAREAISKLRNQFAELDHLKSKFKLFRVSQHDDQVVTEQYFHLGGQSPTQSIEHNAKWLIGWSQSVGETLPVIRWIRVLEAEQVVARIAGNPWLVDCTQSMLPITAGHRLCLQRGIPQWMSRLEAVNGIYNFGHHGIAVGDVNSDGLDDVYVCQTGGLPNHLFLQQPNGTLRDTAAASGVDFLDNTRSALLIDLDNDDDQDLVLALSSGLVLMENEGQAGFAVRARINSVKQAFSLVAADYDQDGFLDVYVCVYYATGDEVSDLPLPLPYFNATNGGQNHLIRNLGRWRFDDVTSEVGLDDDNRRFSFAATWTDDDNDGDLDLMVVNDSGPNHLYRNEGGQFRNAAKEVGLVDGAFGMSATVSDYDHDGWQDLYVSNMFSAAGNRITFQSRFKPSETSETRARFQHLARGNSLFRNSGNGTFADVSVGMGVTMGRWSWGSLFVDLNNDSWEDLLVTNGFITGKMSDDL